MKYATPAVLAALLLAVGGGYWLGKARVGAGDTAAVPAVVATAAPATPAPRKLLYYRNPMGLADTSPVPKKDSMGMDYVAVYEGEEGSADPGAAPGEVKISTEKVQKLGVRTEPAGLRALDRTVRAAGRIEPDERRTYAIAPKFEGYVERLHVNATGQPVSKGQPLFEVYSPELVSAQREYAIAAQGVESLKAAGGEAQNSSPVAGIVTEKKALQGMRFMPGEALYLVADLSAVWVVADVFEQDIGLLKVGAGATVKINAYPEKVFKGVVTYVYPTLKAETRTIPVRVELANPGQLLKPGMFAEVEIAVAAKGPVVAVPISAVIDSGTRRIVLVQKAEGRFEPREVRLGARSDTYVEVMEGVKDGEPVVVAANFLIDAESNLKAALGGFAAPAGSAPATTSKAVGHQATGTLDAIDAKAGSVTVTHGPVPSLKWPGMTMDFVLANPALTAKLKPGSAVSIEFVERKPGEWVITKMDATAVAKPITPAAAPAADPHKGH
jgi:Cu(I)/Ag(I) efflux system membrane fusion protein